MCTRFMTGRAIGLVPADVPKRTAMPVVVWHVPAFGAMLAEVTAAGRIGDPGVSALALGVETTNERVTYDGNR